MLEKRAHRHTDCAGGNDESALAEVDRRRYALDHIFARENANGGGMNAAGEGLTIVCIAIVL